MNFFHRSDEKKNNKWSIFINWLFFFFFFCWLNVNLKRISFDFSSDSPLPSCSTKIPNLIFVFFGLVLLLILVSSNCPVHLYYGVHLYYAINWLSILVCTRYVNVHTHTMRLALWLKRKTAARAPRIFRNQSSHNNKPTTDGRTYVRMNEWTNERACSDRNPGRTGQTKTKPLERNDAVSYYRK